MRQSKIHRIPYMYGSKKTLYPIGFYTPAPEAMRSRSHHGTGTRKWQTSRFQFRKFNHFQASLPTRRFFKVTWASDVDAIVCGTTSTSVSKLQERNQFLHDSLIRWLTGTRMPSPTPPTIDKSTITQTAEKWFRNYWNLICGDWVWDSENSPILSNAVSSARKIYNTIFTIETTQ